MDMASQREILSIMRACKLCIFLFREVRQTPARISPAVRETGLAEDRMCGGPWVGECIIWAACIDFLPSLVVGVFLPLGEDSVISLV